jgi:prenyltransferase beta subunit
MKRTLFGGIVFLLVAAPALGQTADQKKATIAYLQKLQNKDGGFRPNEGAEKSSLRATLAALRALKYFGGEVPDPKKAAEFVKSCYDKTTNGGYADEPGGKASVAVTAVGLMAMVELKIPTELSEAAIVSYLQGNVKTFEDVRIAVAGFEAIGRVPGYAKAWTEIVEKRRTAPPGDGTARDVGGATVALLRMGVKPADTAAVVAVLDSDQRPDGGFNAGKDPSSDLESTYRVLRCYHMLKSKPKDVARLREFVAKCRNDDGGYGVTRGQKSAVGPTYFASIILHWLDEK